MGPTRPQEPEPEPDGERPGAVPQRRSDRFILGVTAFAMLLGACMIRDGLQTRQGPPQPPGAARGVKGAAGSGEAASLGLPPPPAPLPASQPLRVRIPSIRVDAPLMNVGLDRGGWIEPPPAEDKNLAGWYRGAVAPGADGTAVVVGHVDNADGPVVFYNLGALRKGSTVEVARQDGRTAVFTIYGIDVFDKYDFPGGRVYGATGQPELRVITCGGGYTKASGYQGNVVVFARLTATR